MCVGTPDILQLPSGRLIASMELWLKRPTSGDEGGIDYPHHCKVKASDDGGKTWDLISTNGITWGSLEMQASRETRIHRHDVDLRIADTMI